MKIKTSELTGAALDWAVAKAAGYAPKAFIERDCGQAAFRPLTKWCGIDVTPGGHTVWNPSTDWSQGGPIIERERINLVWWGLKCSASKNNGPIASRRIDGPTALIAAMRCYVASKLGDEVDVPEELCEQISQL